MARFYFHVIDAASIMDTQGIELAGVDEARAMAIRSAGEIISSEGDTFWKEGKWSMSVEDMTGDVCFRLDFLATPRSQISPDPFAIIV